MINLTFEIENDAGRRFTVRIIEQGGQYGAGDGITHNSPDPLVEFWDLENPRTAGAARFIARYFLSTLWQAHGNGIAFDASIPEWSLDAETLHDCLQRIQYKLSR